MGGPTARPTQLSGFGGSMCKHACDVASAPQPLFPPLPPTGSFSKTDPGISHVPASGLTFHTRKTEMAGRLWTSAQSGHCTPPGGAAGTGTRSERSCALHTEGNCDDFTRLLDQSVPKAAKTSCLHRFSRKFFHLPLCTAPLQHLNFCSTSYSSSQLRRQQSR